MSQKTADAVVPCVTGSPEVEAVVQDEDGLAAAAKPLLVIGCSKAATASTTRFADLGGVFTLIATSSRETSHRQS